MGDIVTFSQRDGTKQFWVPAGEESAWVRRFQSWGCPACTVHQYREWGGFWPPATGSADRVMLRRGTRRRTNYARWGRT